MISKGKRRYIQDLYRPDMEFFTRDGKHCVKLGGHILVGIVPISMGGSHTIETHIDSFIPDPNWANIIKTPRLFETGTRQAQPNTPINEPYRPQQFFKDWGNAIHHQSDLRNIYALGSLDRLEHHD